MEASYHSFGPPEAVLALFGPLTPQTLLQLPEELRKHNSTGDLMELFISLPHPPPKWEEIHVLDKYHRHYMDN